MARELIA